MRSHICWRDKRSIPYMGVEINICYGGFGLLQMISELDTEQCVNENARPSMRVDCETPHRLERGTKHFLNGCENKYLLVVGLICYKWYQS